MQALGPMAAPEVVVLTTHGAASDDKAGSMTTPRALNEARVGNSVPTWRVSLWLLRRVRFEFCDGNGEA